MRMTAPNKEITAQALGAAIVAFVLGAIQWYSPLTPSPPPGFEAGAAVLAGYIIARIRKLLQRRKMTEIERAVDEEFCAGRVHLQRDGGDNGVEEPTDQAPPVQFEDDGPRA